MTTTSIFNQNQKLSARRNSTVNDVTFPLRNRDGLFSHTTLFTVPSLSSTANIEIDGEDSTDQTLILLQFDILSNEFFFLPFFVLI